MADIADLADIQNSKLHEVNIANSRVSAGSRKGPTDCMTCGEWNDRAEQGYATCSDCFNDLNRD